MYNPFRRGITKSDVKAHWEGEPCGTRGISPTDRKAFFRQVESERYSLEPYLLDFARFDRGRGKQVLEIGVGTGTDFINWVRNGAVATGIDLTERGALLTQERLRLERLKADVYVGDAENLPFSSNTFDLVYSYGVLHHTPNTEQAIYEVHRTLKQGGRALIMIYHIPSWTGFMLWFIHCLGKNRPWKGAKWAIYHHLESPGTKAYTVAEARKLFSCFSTVSIRTQIGLGDLLLMRPGQNYQGRYFKLAWALYPRWAVKLMGNRLGLFMFIEAIK